MYFLPRKGNGNCPFEAHTGDIKDHERWIDLRFHEEPQEHHEEELLAEY